MKNEFDLPVAPDSKLPAKNGFKLPNESFNYAYAAQQEGQRAGILANYGYRFKQLYYEKESILQKWQDFMINAPVVLHNTLFILFFVVDILVSWEMVKEVISNGGVFIGREVPWWATLLLCLLINAWAAATAHFIGKGWSKEIQDWERWNLAFVKRQNDMPPNLLDAKINQEIRRARILAIISGVILFAVVALIVYYRNVLLKVLAEENDYNALATVMTFLPLAILLGELLTGDYVWYSIKWLQTYFGRNRNRRKFLSYKEQCGAADQLAVQYTTNAMQREQPVQIVGDLEYSHLRFKHRSQQNDDYIDPFDKWRKIGFTFRQRGNQRPVSDVYVAGILPNGAKTGDYRTDADGKVTLHWDGEFDRLLGVRIVDKEYVGPFQPNAEHYIDLPDDTVASWNGNGRQN